MANERIAVVYPEQDFLLFMEQFLKIHGYQAVLIRDGNAVLSVAREEKPDVVILDSWLERQDDGWNIIQLLRMAPETKQIPIIVCSTDSRGLAAKATLLQTLNCEALEKPFDLDVLEQKIERALAVGNSHEK